MPGRHRFFLFQKNYCSSILKKNYLQEKDRGTYQARVVSKAGECYSSLITIEVEPGPEWEGVTNGWIGSKKQNKPCLCVSDHYGAEMATVAADSANEGAQHRLMLGLSHSYGSSIIPTGWIRGTVGSWEIKKSLEEREVVEREGKAAKLAESERKKLFEWLLQQPFAETQEDIEQRRRDSMQFAVSEAVRNTLFRIWVEQDMTLHIQLEANYDALCQYLSDANDWPSQPLKKSVEKLLVGTTLNHTWETHLEYEQELAEGWAESFDLIRATWTIRWGGFRSKHLKFNPRPGTSASSISDSLSGSEEEEEVEERMLNYDAECKSERVGEEGSNDECSDEDNMEEQDDDDDEDATFELQKLLLNNHQAEEKVSLNICIF